MSAPTAVSSRSAHSLTFDAIAEATPGPLAPLRDGPGLLPGSSCPHDDGEPERRPAYHRFLVDGALPAGYAADDGAALHWIGTTLERVITSRREARAYRVEARDGNVHEIQLPRAFVG